MNGLIDGSIRHLNDCGCCEGLASLTPVEIENHPGLTAIAYRVGTHAEFKGSMLARLSASEFAVLQRFRTREDDDFSIALLDAWATVADVLTFYQERIAHESYLRTATERRSLLELARLIGYELQPGVAASTYLAFTLEDAPGAPRQTTIDVGAKVQSVPGPNEKPAIFETIDKIDARTDWNAVRPQLTRSQALESGTKHLYLKGVNTQLQTGDAILLVDREREGDPNSTRWAFRLLQTVKTIPEKDITEVAWKEGLSAGLPSGQPAKEHVKVFALRQRAPLFGHNAPEWGTMPVAVKKAYKTDATDDSTTWGPEWPGFKIQDNQLDLDATYPKIVIGSWVVVTKPNFAQAHKAMGVTSISRAQFAVSAKIARIDPDRPLELLPLRNTTVFAQSEELEIAEMPFSEPVDGVKVALRQLVPDLKPGQALAVSGKRVRARIAGTAQGLKLKSADGSKSHDLKPGDLLQVMTPPVLMDMREAKPTVLTSERRTASLTFSPPYWERWHLMDRDGFKGWVVAAPGNIIWQPATKDDALVSEVVFIGNTPDAVTSDRERTTITLSESLKNSYDRETVTINANIARATHGETVQEVLGGGDAGQSYQRFALRQPPLTHVSASTASGAQSTLQVRVNDLLWHEAATLYGRGPNDHVYIARTGDDGKTTIQSGDGVTGARLPSGQENVRAVYRKGIGLEGRVKGEQLSLLLTRPLGVKSVINPEASTGGADPESRADARRNAPLTVLTLDRTVSLQDYEDFARAYAGIAKALATWTWEGQTRRVFITVAGPDGADVPSGSDLYKNLLAAMKKAGDPFVNVTVKSYRKALFRLAANIKIHSDHLREKVVAAVQQSLRDEFSFDRRTFGQPVMLSEVIAVIQAVPGVVAVDVDKFYRSGQPAAPNHRLLAALPEVGADGDMAAAELLRLDAAPLDALGVMP